MPGPHDFAVRSDLHHPFDGHVLPTEVLAKALKRRSSARWSIAHRIPCPAIAASRRRCRVHRIPSRVRDDRDPPLLPGWDDSRIELSLPVWEAENFSMKGWTAFSDLPVDGQIS
jgi:hypothetical protein